MIRKAGDFALRNRFYVCLVMYGAMLFLSLPNSSAAGMLKRIDKSFPIRHFRTGNYMIARLVGSVTDTHSQLITVMVQGVGYAVGVVDERLYVLNSAVDLHIYYHYNQENGPQLYGFQSAFERMVFAQILSCSGCGPKIGLAVLAHLSATEFVRAIAQGDARILSGVSGIGPKKAELMIMQLKDKVMKITPAAAVADQGVFAKIKQVSAALTALNYKPAEISSALEHLKSSDLETMPFDELLRRSLSHLVKRL